VAGGNHRLCLSDALRDLGKKAYQPFRRPVWGERDDAGQTRAPRAGCERPGPALTHAGDNRRGRRGGPAAQSAHRAKPGTRGRVGRACAAATSTSPAARPDTPRPPSPPQGGRWSQTASRCCDASGPRQWSVPRRRGHADDRCECHQIRQQSPHAGSPGLKSRSARPHRGSPRRAGCSTAASCASTRCSPSPRLFRAVPPFFCEVLFDCLETLSYEFRCTRPPNSASRFAANISATTGLCLDGR